MLRIHEPHRDRVPDPVVITGIGMITSVGDTRESTWQAIRAGRSGVRRVLPGDSVPSHLGIAAVVDSVPELPQELKVIHLARKAADEAIADSRLDLDAVDGNRCACAVSGHMGDWRWLRQKYGVAPPDQPGDISNWEQFFPNSGCWNVATRYGFNGPRICHSTACASGLIDVMCAVRAIKDNQCDIALAGSAEAIDPLFAAGFQQMRVLAQADGDPSRACRPFDRSRSGFVMGEGGAMFVLERLSHAEARGAKIYGEIIGGKMLADAHHMTGLDLESEALTHLLRETLRRNDLHPSDIGYINAHGTGTMQNDVMESRGIRRALGSHADDLCVSGLKSMLGHLVNASGSVELALTTLALRDGFVPPTINLTDPDPDCDLDYVPLVGQDRRVQTAIKLALAFGGHLVAVALRRWNDGRTGFAYPVRHAA
ncbi:MAG: beta-ketoacyl-[acyl-carrier-protein] synthase family protein [Planctomycetales bacterium]|nr:beta-ketoacyl-[acyl-carrier-protein] synthase family protein [Planctomycetales bacterium]